VIHSACETLVREIKAGGVPSAIDTTRATEVFAHVWAASGLTGLALFAEGESIMTDFARDEGVVAPDNVLAVEQRFVLPVGRFAVVGVIDRVNRLDAETVEVVDFKTNHQLFTREELDNDLQLPLYAAAAKALWPWARNVRLTYWMLRQRIRVPLARTSDQIAAALRYVRELAEQAATATAFEAKLGAHCAYCDHRGSCDAYAAALRGARRFACADETDVAAVAAEREEVAGLARILDGRKKELDRLLRSRLKGCDELRAAGMRYRMVPTRSPAQYPLAATLTAIAAVTGAPRDALVDRLAVIDRDALDALLSELGATVPKPRLTMLRAELDARATRTVSPRFTATEDRSR
jgi:hypothetical protein